jgi:hypothetical protein
MGMGEMSEDSGFARSVQDLATTSGDYSETNADQKGYAYDWDD